MFESAKFIEFPAPFDPTPKEYDPAPVFKRQFSLKEKPHKAELCFVALGLGYVYLNGKPITKDLFNTPVSDYLKTLWYHTYDVTELLVAGENEIAVIVGNGWYNEFLKTGWDFDAAPWRGAPKLLLTLTADTFSLNTDENWAVSRDISPVVYHQLRSGETYDCRRGEAFLQYGIDGYLPVKLSETPPTGILRPCPAQPVRAFESYEPIAVFKNKNGNTVYDFGQNISGYLDITLRGCAGEVITIHHGERVFEDGTLDHREMDSAPFHSGHDFQTNRAILSGKVDTPLTRFTYHGFRFAEIEGDCEIIAIRSVFVHQAVDKISDFQCSVELLNQISRCGDYSVWSNMFYALTDCPTREKLGWTNDALASAEQILMNFDSLPFFEKWLQDIFDGVTENGNLYNVIPSGGWGLDFCTGPLCTGIIFELPLMMYKASGNLNYIRAAYPYMQRHLDWMLSNKTDTDGLLGYGLGDWTGGHDEKFLPTPKKFVDTALALKFAGIILISAELLGEQNTRFEQIRSDLYDRFFAAFYDSNVDRCIVDTQTAVSMMICLKNGGATEGLAAQLRKAVADRGYHHDCGMVGMQYLLPALDQIGSSDLVYKMLTAKGYPSYSWWMEDGATTLYEMWNKKKSANHHMNSSAVAWFMKKLVGLAQQPDGAGYTELVVCPYFPEDMDFCTGNLRGKAAAEWKKQGAEIYYHLTLNQGVRAAIVPPKGYTASVSGTVSEGEYDIVFAKAK